MLPSPSLIVNVAEPSPSNAIVTVACEPSLYTQSPTLTDTLTSFGCSDGEPAHALTWLRPYGDSFFGFVTVVSPVSDVAPL